MASSVQIIESALKTKERGADNNLGRTILEVTGSLTQVCVALRPLSVHTAVISFNRP